MSNCGGTMVDKKKSLFRSDETIEENLSYTPLHLWANQKAQDAGLENAFGLLDPDERTFEGNALIPDPGAVCPGCCANCSSTKETPLDALAKVSTFSTDNLATNTLK